MIRRELVDLAFKIYQHTLPVALGGAARTARISTLPMGTAMFAVVELGLPPRWWESPGFTLTDPEDRYSSMYVYVTSESAWLDYVCAHSTVLTKEEKAALHAEAYRSCW